MMDQTEQQLRMSYLAALEQYFVTSMKLTEIAEAAKQIHKELLGYQKTKNLINTGLPPKLKNLHLPQMKQLNKEVVQTDFKSPL